MDRQTDGQTKSHSEVSICFTTCVFGFLAKPGPSLALSPQYLLALRSMFQNLPERFPA